MLSGRSTLIQHIIEEQRRFSTATGEFTGLLADLAKVCKVISTVVSKGELALYPEPGEAEESVPSTPSTSGPLSLSSISSPPGTSSTSSAPGTSSTPGTLSAETQAERLRKTAHQLFVRLTEYGGSLAGMLSDQTESVRQIPAQFPRGKYLLVFDPLDGTSNLDVNVPVGTLFSILRHERASEPPTVTDFLQAGARQLAAGYALYGPATMLVLTTGNGVNGFTLDRENGEFVLTHPSLRIPANTNYFAVDPSTTRHWDAGIKRYVDECLLGSTGPLKRDYETRWNSHFLPETHRILLRGGVFLSPRNTTDPSKQNNKRVLHETNPVAMIVEQAGGAASTGRERMLDVVPTGLHQRAGFIFGSSEEVHRIERYVRETAPSDFSSPLFGRRGLFR